MASFILWTGESLQDPEDGKAYILPLNVVVDASAGGLSIPIAMYHHTHHNLSER
jgi:hypothetical protein